MMKLDTIRKEKILCSMSEFGGLRNPQNNPVFSVEVGHYGRRRSCQSLVDYGNTQIPHHALKVSVFIRLKLNTIRKKTLQSMAEFRGL